MIKNANLQFCFQAVHTQSDPIFISNNINVYIKTQFLRLGLGFKWGFKCKPMLLSCLP